MKKNIFLLISLVLVVGHLNAHDEPESLQERLKLQAKELLHQTEKASKKISEKVHKFIKEVNIQKMPETEKEKEIYFENLFFAYVAGAHGIKESQKIASPSQGATLEEVLEWFDAKSKEELFQEQEVDVIEAALLIRAQLLAKGYSPLWNGWLLEQAAKKVVKNSYLMEGFLSQNRQVRFITQEELVKRIVPLFECAYHGPSKGCQGIGLSGYLGGQLVHEIAALSDPFEPIKKENNQNYKNS